MSGISKIKRTHVTNKAIKLLKTKGRPNEQSQTKPIYEVKSLKTKENAYQQSHYLVENKGCIISGGAAIG
jgi:hypothetical protein